MCRKQDLLELWLGVDPTLCEWQHIETQRNTETTEELLTFSMISNLLRLICVRGALSDTCHKYTHHFVPLPLGACTTHHSLRVTLPYLLRPLNFELYHFNFLLLLYFTFLHIFRVFRILAPYEIFKIIYRLRINF